MAARTLSRRALREQNDQAERADDETPEEASDETTDDEESEEAKPKAKKPRTRKAATPKVPKVKAPAKPRATRKRAVKAPPRMFARWAVCDGGLKRIAVFEYKDRAAADAKLAQLQEQRKGVFVILMVKDPYDPPPPPEPVVAVETVVAV